MKKLLFVIIIFISGCNTNSVKNNFDRNFDFSNMTLNEFKLKLKDYAVNSPYPNINN